MAPQHVERPTEWGVLFALTLAEDREVFSKVRLNKMLALLQRDGFPIPNRFSNLDMGPFDPWIHEDAVLLENRGLVSIDEKPVRNKNPVTIYRLNDKGFRFFQQKYGCLVEALPFKRIFDSKREEVKRSFDMMTSELVDRVHEELLTQVTPEFLEEKMTATEKSLRQLVNTVEGSHDDSCPVCLEVQGSAEFASTSIRNAIDRGLRTKESGKNMIYFNSSQILHWATRLAKHDHVTDVRMDLDDKTTKLREQLCYRLYCLEENAGLYRIAQPIRDESSIGDYLQQHLGGVI